jgi:hypothetical protein
MRFDASGEFMQDGRGLLSFLPFSLSAACLKFFAFRFRAAPPGDDPTLIDA